MKFKDYLQEEGFVGDAFNFMKKKLFGLFQNIKSYVLKSKKVEPGAVTFQFPNLPAIQPETEQSDDIKLGFGAFKDKPISEVPSDYLAWCKQTMVDTNGVYRIHDSEGNLITVERLDLEFKKRGLPIFNPIENEDELDNFKKEMLNKYNILNVPKDHDQITPLGKDIFAAKQLLNQLNLPSVNFQNMTSKQVKNLINDLKSKASTSQTSNQTNTSQTSNPYVAPAQKTIPMRTLFRDLENKKTASDTLNQTNIYQTPNPYVAPTQKPTPATAAPAAPAQKNKSQIQIQKGKPTPKYILNSQEFLSQQGVSNDVLKGLSRSEINQLIKNTQSQTELKNTSPLEKIDYAKAGLIFEIECYNSCKKEGLKGLSDDKIPKYYEKYKILLANFIDEIIKHANELAASLIQESYKIMPCVDSVMFNGGAMNTSNGRTDPADIKLVCEKDYVGYSLKYKTSKVEQYRLINTKSINIPTIKTSVDFAKFLNKCISENNRTFLAIGGPKIQYLAEKLEKDFDRDPSNPAIFLPKNNVPIEKTIISENSYKIRYGNTVLRIFNLKSGLKGVDISFI